MEVGFAVEGLVSPGAKSRDDTCTVQRYGLLGSESRYAEV